MNNNKDEAPLYILRKLSNNESILSLEFIQSNYLISGNIQGKLDLWDLEIMRCVNSCNLDSKYPIIQTNFSDFYNCLYIQNRKGDIYYTNSLEHLNNFDKLTQLNTNYSLAKFITLPKEEKLLIPEEGQISLIKIKNNHDKLEFKFPTSSYDKLTVIESINEYSFVAGFESGNIIIWDTRNSKSHILMENISRNVPILEIKRAHNRIWVSTFDSKLQIFNRNNFNKPVKIFNMEYVVDKIAVRSDSLITITSNSSNNSLEVFENKTMESIQKFQWNSKEINSICFSKNSNLFATSSSIIAVWDLYNSSYLN